ncbi:MAG: HEAT repeat domain-containing protein [bacterium]|nr:HEAT repeat domain-containing protein [bacterium]
MQRFGLPVLLLWILIPATVHAELLGAEVQSMGAPRGGLDSAFQSLLESTDDLAWAAYSVPMVTGSHTLCCGSHGPCSLERRGGHYVDRESASKARDLRVMMRMRAGRLSEIRVFSDNCEVDASGLRVHVWDEIDAAESLDFLLARAEAGGKDLAEEALMAIAHHRGERVDRVLEGVARGERLARVGEEAIFWLGEARGTGGFEALERLRRDLDDRDLREQIAFALHLSEDPNALPALIDMARHDEDGEAREKALFWLSQEAGEKAAAAVAEAVDEDPDQEVKEAAIFAISQLPSERGVPLLIRYAESHDNREVRKKAIFWLGQSEDPRALDFFERVLTQ